MSDFITVLTHTSLPLAKTWNKDGSITPYSTAKQFKHKEVPLDSIDDLAKLLDTLGRSPRSCVIRGKFKGDEYAASDPEHQPGFVMRRLDLFEDLPHHWLLVEVDSFTPQAADPVGAPVSAITEYIQTLPACFHEASYYWQLSNSAGHPKNAGVLKVHLWFWLETPYASDHLKAWATAEDIPLDKATMNPVQVHYTAAPIFADGLKDPVPRRSGLVKGTTDSVPLVLPDAFTSVAASPKQTRLQVLENTYQSDPVASRLFERGMVKSTGKKGELFIECPCSDRHTGDSAETTTVYYPPNTGGHPRGHFKCMHEHCKDEPEADFTRALGFTPDLDFEEYIPEPELPEITKSVAAVGANRFTCIPCHLFAIDIVQQWIIKKVLPAAELIVMYGGPGAGKSFMAIDMACAIAMGKPWAGYKVAKKGRVAYVCAEGSEGFRRRLRAYSMYHSVPLEEIDVVVVPHSPNLLKGDDVRDLIRALHAAGPFVLVILDTLARATAGGNENSGEDMGMAIDQARVIAQVLHTTVMFIHHTGKDESKGARGHSSLRAAADCEIEIARNGDDRCLGLGKQKDEDDSLECPFKLVRVVLGLDEDGEEISSCAINHQRGGGGMSRIKNRQKSKGQNELLVLDAFNEICLSPDQGVTEMEVIDKAIAMKGEPESPRARSNMKTNLIRAIKTLCRDEILLSIDGVLTMYEQEDLS